MEFLPQEIDAFITRFSDKEPELLAQLNHETWEKVLIPRMLSGHFQGRVISMLSHMIQPKRILEIGTYTGYSAICFAEIGKSEICNVNSFKYDFMAPITQLAADLWFSVYLQISSKNNAISFVSVKFRASYIDKL